MKHIVFSIVLLFCCFQVKAQVAMAEIDSLYGYWKKYHMEYNVDLIYKNIPDVGLLKQYKFRIPTHIVVSDSILESMGLGNDGFKKDTTKAVYTYAQADLSWYRRSYNVGMQSIATIEALMNIAKEKDKWESRAGSVDTMMYSLVFADTDEPIPLNDNKNTMVDAAEYLTSSYYSMHEKEEVAVRHEGYLFYSCLLDSVKTKYQHFDFEEFLKLLSPILERPDIECRSIYLSHSSDMWRHSAYMFYVDLDEEPCGKGETNGFVFMMQDDKLANEVLSKIKEVIQEYTATHFDLPYIYIPNQRWGGQDERLFYATNSRFPRLDENTLKLDIRMGDWGMEHNLLVAVTQGDRLLPINWIQYSRIVDGNEVRVR